SHAVAYLALRGRVREVVESADREALDAIVPATPEWRARDVLAHLVGVADDVVNGRLDGIATDPWTRAQVDAPTQPSPGDLVARVEASRFELFRAVTGRRTAAEVAGYGWDRDPDAELLLGAPIFKLRRRSLGE